MKEEKVVGESMKSQPVVPRHGAERTPSPDPRPRIIDPAPSGHSADQGTGGGRGGEARRRGLSLKV